MAQNHRVDRSRIGLLGAVLLLSLAAKPKLGGSVWDRAWTLYNHADCKERKPGMSHEKKGRELGMGREITRRDFLNGVAIGVGGTLIEAGIGEETLLAAAAFDEFAPEKAPLLGGQHEISIRRHRQKSEVRNQNRRLRGLYG